MTPSDFTTWERKILEQFARDAADENKILKQQVKDLLTALRKEWLKC